MTILSLIATITDCLTDKRLAFCIETDEPNKGLITGVQFFGYSTGTKATKRPKPVPIP